MRSASSWRLRSWTARSARPVWATSRGKSQPYQELIDSLGEHDGPRAVMAAALRNLRLAETGGTEEALQGCRDLEESLSSLNGGLRVWVSWLDSCARAMVLAVQHDASATGAFRSTYAAFPTGGDEFTTRNMIRFVLNLIAVGESESDLVEGPLQRQLEGPHARAPDCRFARALR